MKIKACRTTLETIQKLAKEQAGDSLKAEMKQIDKSLRSIEKELFGGEEVQGIFRDKNSFTNKVSPLLYLGYTNKVITPNQMLAIDAALLELDKMEIQITEFLEKDWTDFRLVVESHSLSLFGEK